MSKHPQAEPADAPPAYDAGPSTSSLVVPQLSPTPSRSSDGTHSNDSSSHLPLDQRHELENANRDLPEGWVKEIDAKSHHVYYVDTNVTPPRSCWNHPYDDPTYLASLPDTDPHPHSRASQQGASNRASSSSQTGATGHAQLSNHRFDALHTDKPDKTTKSDGKKSFGRKLKDKLTNSTHEEREASRARERALEKKAYEAYLTRRAAAIEAQRNGTYQSRYSAPMGAYSRGNYSGYGGRYGGGGYGYGGGYGGYGGGLGMMGMGLGGGLLLGGGAGLMMGGDMGGDFGGGGMGC